jgi:hypothetical protein
MRLVTPIIMLVLVIFSSAVQAEKLYEQVDIIDPYIDLHTGAGRGYPIFYTAERGEKVEVMHRRTDWVQVRTSSGKEGWVDLEQMRQTLQDDGELTEYNDGNMTEYTNHRWETGFMGGDFGGANVLSGYLGYSFTRNLSAELAVSQLLGEISDGNILAVNIVHTFFPRWRASPFFSLGTGVITVKPKATLVQAEDRRDRTAIVGFGVKAYVTRRILFRGEYKNYYVFGSRDENEDVNEWKLGFSVFF